MKLHHLDLHMGTKLKTIISFEHESHTISARAQSRPISILGTGHVLPGRLVLSSELDTEFGFPQGTVFKSGGVRQRHFATDTDTAALLGAQAADHALQAAGLSLADIDCLISASATMDQGMPCNAALILHSMGASSRSIPAFDINASCLGFLAALDTISWSVVARRYRRVLIVAADVASCGLDWTLLESSAIFGDGAAAAVIGLAEAGQSSRILHSLLTTFSAGAHFCEIPAGGSRFHPSRINEPFDPLTKFKMDGKKTFKLAATHLPEFVATLLSEASTPRNSIDWIVPHQASQLALNHLTKKLNFCKERVIDIFADHGNQVAASLPTTLDWALRSGRIQRGQRLLLLGTGAGLSIGGMVLDY